MNYDLVLCGVGGQGVLSIAWVADHAAHDAGLYLKQSEVHGMAQRGGAVSAFVRISDTPVASDLIADGTAGMILSVEPLEALRYAKLLRPDGWIVCDVTPMVNIDNYPDLALLYRVLFGVPNLVAIDATRLAQKAGTPKAQNMVVLGAASPHLPLSAELLEKQLRELFEPKGDRVVRANIDAFRSGAAASVFSDALVVAGVLPGIAARVTSRIAFDPSPVDGGVVDAWRERLLAPDGAVIAQQLFDAGKPVAPADVPALRGQAAAA